MEKYNAMKIWNAVGRLPKQLLFFMIGIGLFLSALQSAGVEKEVSVDAALETFLEAPSLENLEVLRATGFDLNTTIYIDPPEDFCVIAKACTDDDVHVIRPMLARSVPRLFMNKRLIHIVVELGVVDLVDALLRAGVDHTVAAIDCRTPLDMIMCMPDKGEKVEEFCFKKERDWVLAPTALITPFKLALYSNNVAILKAFLAHDQSLMERERFACGATVFHAAADANQFDQLRCFALQNNEHITVNTPDDNGYIPLHLTAMQGNREMIQELLSLGADSRAKARGGESVLYCALAKKHAAVAALLVRYGAVIGHYEKARAVANNMTAVLIRPADFLPLHKKAVSNNDKRIVGKKRHELDQDFEPAPNVKKH